MLHKSKERDFPWQLRGAISLSSPRLNSLFLFDSSLAIFRDMISMRARRHYYYYRRHRTNGSITEGRTWCIHAHRDFIIIIIATTCVIIPFQKNTHAAAAAHTRGHDAWMYATCSSVKIRRPCVWNLTPHTARAASARGAHIYREREEVNLVPLGWRRSPPLTRLRRAEWKNNAIRSSTLLRI